MHMPFPATLASSQWEALTKKQGCNPRERYVMINLTFISK